MKGLRFSIRDLLLLTTIAAVALGWWLDHRDWWLVNQEKEERINELEFQSRKWHIWTQHLTDQLNGTKVNGKWLFPWCYVFEPGGKQMTQPKRQSPGDSLVPAGASVEWRKEWAELR